MSEQRASEYDDFLADLQSVVADQVETLRARQSALTPKAFLDPEKVVRDWPELAGRLLEEYR